MNDPPDPQKAQEARAYAGSHAAAMLEAMDEETLRLWNNAAEAIIEFGARLAGRGLPPEVVLGQMQQVVASAFARELMPHWALVVKEPPEGS